jgi:hypothetical protein
MKLNPSATSISATALLGGSAASSATAIAVDATGKIWVAGYTESLDFPVTVLPSFAGSLDGFVVELGPDGTSIQFSRYLGGSGDDRCSGIVLTQSGDPVVVGLTSSVDFPAMFASAPAPYNAFVTRIRGAAIPQAISVSPASGRGTSGTFTFTFSDPAPVTSPFPR